MRKENHPRMSEMKKLAKVSSKKRKISKRKQHKIKFQHKICFIKFLFSILFPHFIKHLLSSLNPPPKSKFPLNEAKNFFPCLRLTKWKYLKITSTSHSSQQFPFLVLSNFYFPFVFIVSSKNNKESKGFCCVYLCLSDFYKIFAMLWTNEQRNLRDGEVEWNEEKNNLIFFTDHWTLPNINRIERSLSPLYLILGVSGVCYHNNHSSARFLLTGLYEYFFSVKAVSCRFDSHK